MMDVVLGTMGLAVAGPVLAGIWIAMRSRGDRGPFLYRAARVGEAGQLITVLKIRTMAPDAAGGAITSHDDVRITDVGRILRRYKLDELPQLWNVLRGDMGLVGPRPEDPSFVDLRIATHRKVFTARPGITGPAQLAFRNEAELLTGPDPDRMYRETILPTKLELDSHYLDHWSVRNDLQILARTAASIVLPRSTQSN